MNGWTDFVRSRLARGASAAEGTCAPLIGAYGDALEEYGAIAKGPALVDRSYRGLLQISGVDRGSWLHNFTTNFVKTLGSNEGTYAFALNVQGRILFDLNVLIRSESIWIDLDRRFVTTALQHFDKYTITEDVTTRDRSDDFVRLAVVGPDAMELLSTLGAPHVGTLPALGATEIAWGDAAMTLVRHDFCGPLSGELFVPVPMAVKVWQKLTDPSLGFGAVPAGDDAVQMHRIEAGIPWPGREITDEYLPAETGQLERAVSFVKGCYLGQEVVERMRTRDVVARRLIGLQMDGEVIPPGGADILGPGDKVIGSVTSACRSPLKRAVIGMGYVKTASSDEGTSLRVSWDGQSAEAAVVPLPFTTAPVC